MKIQEIAKVMPLPSVAAVITDLGCTQFLLSKRAWNHYYRPGVWQFPGGMIEHGETGDFCAAAREAREETGLGAQLHYGMGVVHTDNSMSRQGDHWLCMMVHFFVHNSALPPNPEPTKHEDWRWVSPEFILEKNHEELMAFGMKTAVENVLLNKDKNWRK